MVKALPLMEVPVEPELAPYLVSSLQSVTWVPRTSQTGFIRTAFRARGTLETELINAVLQRSRQENWGSVHPLTPQGLKDAGDYLRSFGIEEIECLAHPLTPVGSPAQRADWAPRGVAVLVPKNRLFLGTMHVVTQEQVAAVLHNPSRGMAFCVAYEG